MLAAFHAQTGVAATVARVEVYQLQSPGVSGLFAPEQALEQLLAGTGLAFRFTSPTSASIDVREQSEFVEVSAAPMRGIVSSPKFIAPLRDIPQTITVIPGDVIRRRSLQQ